MPLTPFAPFHAPRAGPSELVALRAVSAAMHMDTADAVMRALARYIETRDLNGLVSLYESDALFVPEPGVRLVGHDQLRQAFTELLGIDPILELTSTKILESSDLALASNEFRSPIPTPTTSRERALRAGGRAAA